MTGAHTHGTEELCGAGLNLYTRAPRDGRVRRAAADETPRPLGLGLFRPDVEDPRWLRPVAPAFAPHPLRSGVADRIADERRRAERPAALSEPVTGVGSGHPTAAGAMAISVLGGCERIHAALPQAVADAGQEAPAGDQARRDRCGRDRTAPATDQNRRDRPQRDRRGHDRTAPAADQAWRDRPQRDRRGRVRTLDAVTDRLISDAVLADRFGRNTRTARLPGAEVAAARGGESRARLGHLVAGSGILEQEGVTE
ncbi:hypothetical protein ABZT06_33210 [Streptomyces sp. NPDC005483]|uniref:hypothetical protein n=1 Tax=Streptomyces sp. NPDC005483 TaxID=3154882 RepID=UPI0033BB1D01